MFFTTPLHPLALKELHCDTCRLKYGRIIPLGSAVAASDFWVEEGYRGNEDVFDFTVPFGTRVEVKEIKDEQSLYVDYIMSEDGEIGYVSMPYWVRIMEGEYEGTETFAYWCEISPGEQPSEYTRRANQVKPLSVIFRG